MTTPDRARSPENLPRTVAAIVHSTVAELVAEQAVPDATVDDATVLAGHGSPFDSFGLVTIVLEVERRIGDELGIAVALADDRALSQTRSPFRTVASLTDHALARVREAADGTPA